MLQLKCKKNPNIRLDLLLSKLAICEFIVIIYNLGKASRDARSLIYSKKNQGNIINKVL